MLGDFERDLLEVVLACPLDDDFVAVHDCKGSASRAEKKEFILFFPEAPPTFAAGNISVSRAEKSFSRRSLISGASALNGSRYSSLV